MATPEKEVENFGFLLLSIAGIAMGVAIIVAAIFNHNDIESGDVICLHESVNSAAADCYQITRE